MAFLTNAVERINCSQIDPQEKNLLTNMLTALDTDLVAGGYDPQPAFISASRALDHYTEELEVAGVEDDDAEDADLIEQEDEDESEEPDTDEEELVEEL